MDFLPNEEQQQIIDAVADFFNTEHPVERVLASSIETPLSEPKLWQQMGQLGWLGVGQDISVGGSGLSIIEEMLVVIEAGKKLVSPSLLGSLLGARVASNSGNNQLAAQIVSGEAIVALTLPSISSSDNASTNSHSVSQCVTGDYLALELLNAQYLLVCDADGAALVEKNAIAEVTDQECMDESLQLSAITLDNADALAFLPGSEADIFTCGTLLSSAYLLGITENIMQLTLDYASEREQFGQVIGSFQAIKHKFADMALRSEAARSTTIQACLQYQQGSEDTAFDCAAARILTSEAAINSASQSVWIHGGLGFTAEMPVHISYKRAHLMSQLFASDQSLLSTLLAYPLPE